MRLALDSRVVRPRCRPFRLGSSSPVPLHRRSRFRLALRQVHQRSQQSQPYKLKAMVQPFSLPSGRGHHPRLCRRAYWWGKMHRLWQVDHVWWWGRHHQLRRVPQM